MARKEWQQLPDLLTVADLSERYQTSARTIQRRVRNGTLPAPVDPSAQLKQWHPDSIAEFESGL